MKSIALTDVERIGLFEVRPNPIDIVLDTDTFNEIDDQFAVVYALLAKDTIRVQGICAAPFLNSRSRDAGDGMEKSYEEIQRLLQRMENLGNVGVARGSTHFMKEYGQPVQSDAVEMIYNAASVHSPQNPLYIVAIGAPTNVSSALILHPEIISRVVVIWLGGHAWWWSNTAEFNCRQDPFASQVLFDSGVALVQIPCMGVASHLITTVPEIDRYVKGQGAIGDYLSDIYREYQESRPGTSKVIWDIATIGYLRNQSWSIGSYGHSPILNPNMTYSFDSQRHIIRHVHSLDRDAIIGDFYALLSK